MAVKKRSKIRKMLKAAKRAKLLQQETKKSESESSLPSDDNNADLQPFVDSDFEIDGSPSNSVAEKREQYSPKKTLNTTEPDNGYLEIVYKDPLYKHYIQCDKQLKLMKCLKRQFKE